MTLTPCTTRARATKSELAQLDAQILNAARLAAPVSVRHLFYAMTDPRLPEPVDKTENGYRKVQRRCLALRRSGALSYGDIVDATRRGYHVATFTGAGDFIEQMAGHYRAAVWQADDPLVEVWAESRSIAGVIAAECRRLAISLYPAGGFASATLCYEAAQEIDAQDRPEAIVFYVGDFDPAGLLIDRAIERELRKHLATPLRFNRLAINERQIAEHDLPTKPRKPGDRRRRDVAETVEAEAMPAAVLRALVAAAVECHVDPDRLATAQIAEKSERAGLVALGRSWSN